MFMIIFTCIDFNIYIIILILMVIVTNLNQNALVDLVMFTK